jgi:hypothetical protein
MKKLHLHAIQAAAVTSSAFAGPADPPVVEGSQISVNAQASNLSAQGIQGSTKKTSFLGFGSKKVQADMPALLTVGTMELARGARLSGSNIRIDVQADSIVARGSTVRVGAVVVQ